MIFLIKSKQNISVAKKYEIFWKFEKGNKNDESLNKKMGLFISELLYAK